MSDNWVELTHFGQDDVVKITEPGSRRLNDRGKVTFEKSILCTIKEAMEICTELKEILK